MLKNIQNKKQDKELFKNIFKNIKPSQSLCLCGFPGFRLLPRAGADGRFVEQCGVQTAASRPTNAEKEGERKAEKSMHLINKQKKEQRKKGKERCTTNTKKYAERAWPCGRAASGRVAWR